MKRISNRLKRLRKSLERKPRCPKGCNECCTGIFYSPEEKERIDWFIRKNNISLSPQSRKCEYLSLDGKCLIYPERPIICRAMGIIDTGFLKCPHCPQSAKDSFIELESYRKRINLIPNQIAIDILNEVKKYKNS